VRRLCIAGIALLAGLLVSAVALGTTESSVVRFTVSSGARGSVARPVPVGVGFGLSVSDSVRSRRALPIASYRLAVEGLVPFLRSFPACSLSRLRRVRGVPAVCARARIGGGLFRGVAGLAEDRSLRSSLPCNLRVGVYNTGRGMALRVDGKPPAPRSLGSTRLGCVVPVHTAIPVTVSSTRIDGVTSTELSFSVPALLLHPLDGWDASLRVVNVSLDRRTAGAVVRGKRRTVGFFSSAGCRGGSRTLRIVLVGENGSRAVASRSAPC
jgi:hypothetical protein